MRQPYSKNTACILLDTRGVIFCVYEHYSWANVIRPYWKAFSLRPSPLMARRDI